MSSNAVSTQTSGPGVRVVLPEAQRYRQLLEAEEQADLVAQNEAIRQALSSKKRGDVIVVGDVEDEAVAKQLQVGASITRAETRQNRIDCAASDAEKGRLPEAAGTDWLRSTNISAAQQHQQQRPSTSTAGGAPSSLNPTKWKSSHPSSYISPDRRGSGGGDRWAQGTKGLRIAYGAPSLKEMLAEQAGIMRPSTAPQPAPTTKSTTPATKTTSQIGIRSLSPLKESIRLKTEDGGRDIFTKEKDDRMKAVLAQHDATRTSVTEKYRRAAEERRAQREAADAAYVQQTLGGGTSSAVDVSMASSLCASYMTSKKEEADVWGRPAGITAEDDILALEIQKQEKRKLRKNAKKERRDRDVNRRRVNEDEVSSTSSEEDENGHCRTFAEKVAEREAIRLERLNQVAVNCNATSGGTAETRREYFDVGQRVKQAKEDAARARRANIATSAITKAKDPISAGTSLRELLGITCVDNEIATVRPGSGAFTNGSPSKGAPLQLHSPPEEDDVTSAGEGAGVVALAGEFDIDEEGTSSHQRPPSAITNRNIELRLENFGVKESHGVVNTIFGFSPPASRQRMTTHTPAKATSRLATQIAHSRARTAPIPDVGDVGPDTRVVVSALGIDRAGASTPGSSQKRVAWSDQSNQRAQTTASSSKTAAHQQSQSAATAPLTDRPSTAPFAAKVRLTAKPNHVSTDPSYPSVSADHPDPSPVPATSGTYGTLRPPSTREELERARTPAIYIPISNTNPNSDGSSMLRDPDTGLLIDTCELDLTPAELRDKRRHDAQDASRVLSASAAEALRSSRRRLGNITDRAAAQPQQQIQADPQLKGDGYAVVDMNGEEEDIFEGVSVPAGGDDDYDDELFPRPDTAHRQDHSDICGASGDELPSPITPARHNDGGDVDSSFVTLKEQRRFEAAAAQRRLRQQGPIIETSIDSIANNKKHALRPLDEMKLELEVSAMTDELRRRQEDKRKLVHSRESVTSARKDRCDAIQQQVQDLKDEAMNLEGDLADEKQAYRAQYLKEKDTKANYWRQPFVPKHMSEWEAESAAIQKKARDAAAVERGETVAQSPKVLNRLIPTKEDDQNLNAVAAESKIATGDEIAKMDMETRAGYALMREAAIQRLELTTEPTFRHAVHNHENTEFLILWQLWHDTVCGEMESRAAYEHEESTYRRALQNYAHSSFSKAEEMQHMPEMLRDLLAPPSSSLGGFHGGGTRPASSALHQRRPPSFTGSNRELLAASSSPVRAGGGGDRAVVRRLSDTLTQYDIGGIPISGDSPASSRHSNLPPLSPQRLKSGDSSASSPSQQQRRPSSSSARASSPGAATTTGNHIETIQLVEECNVLREELLTYSRDKLKWKQEKRKLRQEYLTLCIERGIRPFADVYVDEAGHAHFITNTSNSMLANSYGDSDTGGGVDRLSLSDSRHNTIHSSSVVSGRLGGTYRSSMPTEEVGIHHNHVDDSSPTNRSDFDPNSRPPSRAITDLDDDVVIHMMNSRPGTGVGPISEIHTPLTAAAGNDRIPGGRLGVGTDSVVTEGSTYSRPSTIPTLAPAAEVDPILALRRRLEIVQWSVDDTEQRELMAKKRLGDLSNELASSH